MKWWWWDSPLSSHFIGCFPGNIKFRTKCKDRILHGMTTDLAISLKFSIMTKKLLNLNLILCGHCDAFVSGKEPRVPHNTL